MTPVALTIAGSDPSGGAGIQADLKTFHQHGVYGEAAITLLTVQNTTAVDRVFCMTPELVTEQVRAVIEDIPPAAAKTGALGDEHIVDAVARLAESFSFPLVIDPVMISKHGSPLISRPAREALKQRLIPHAALVTPNIPEAEALAGISIGDLHEMRKAALAICRMGARAVLVKGGHSAGAATDILYTEGEWFDFSSARIETPHTHGTGCTYSAAITAGLARDLSIPEAVRRAKKFITTAIATAPGLGQGSGPVNHFARVEVAG